jgi:hypothetical protein
MRSVSNNSISCSFASTRSGSNGRFPEANQVVFAPADPAHLLVRTTFGLLESRDGAQSFSWTCENALDISGETDPMLAITANGAVVAATFAGIRRSADGCSYRAPPELAQQIVPDLALDAGHPGSGVSHGAWAAVSSSPRCCVPRTRAKLGRAEPAAERRHRSVSISRQRSRPPLPERAAGRGMVCSVLLRSDDAGQSFERFGVPGPRSEARVHRGGGSHQRRPPVRARRRSARHGPVERRRGPQLAKSFAARLLPGFAIAKDGSEIALAG